MSAGADQRPLEAHELSFDLGATPVAGDQKSTARVQRDEGRGRSPTFSDQMLHPVGIGDIIHHES